MHIDALPGPSGTKPRLPLIERCVQILDALLSRDATTLLGLAPIVGSRRAQYDEAMELEEFRTRFRFEDWFDAWRTELAARGAGECEGSISAWPASLRRMVLEALSDAAPEQFLNPLAASHLRRFGGRLAGRFAPNHVFWVRSEWNDVDLSYGLALPFESRARPWEHARETGRTGELGRCEVKVCYAHLMQGKMKVLAGQLEARRARDREEGLPGAETLRYHGLVWLFSHGDDGRLPSVAALLRGEADGNGLRAVRAFEGDVVTDDLGRLWPTTGGGAYRCRLTTGLFELE
jgi:hypothetical protein